jgi:hypothetical protein
MNAKVGNPMLRREHVVEEMRRSRNQELISKNRCPSLYKIAEEL